MKADLDPVFLSEWPNPGPNRERPDPKPWCVESILAYEIGGAAAGELGERPIVFIETVSH